MIYPKRVKYNIISICWNAWNYLNNVNICELSIYLKKKMNLNLLHNILVCKKKCKSLCLKLIIYFPMVKYYVMLTLYLWNRNIQCLLFILWAMNNKPTQTLIKKTEKQLLFRSLTILNVNFMENVLLLYRTTYKGYT